MRWLPMVCCVCVACSSMPKVTVPAPPPTGQEAEPIAEAKPEPDPAPPAFRLPGDVKPLRYDLELTIVPERERATGSVHVDATVVTPARVVWLNAQGLTISTAKLAGKPARVIQPKDPDDVIGLVADAALPAGPLAIDIAFETPFDRGKSRGLYVEKEGSDDYAYTFFEPIDARRAFPCFDEPNYKVPWHLTFHVKKGHVAAGNAPIASTTDEPDGMQRVDLVESKPMPSYLVAFVVGPFEVIDGGVAPRAKTPIQFIVPKGRAGELGWAKQITAKVVSALESYFDMDYPYGKLDVAVVPRYWGTMEHPGIVAMGQPLTLIRPDQETRARKQHYANILAHELAHYWYGDYVTMAWWDDTWLNEALGQWLDRIITDAVAPEWRVQDDRLWMSFEGMTADENLSTHAIRQPAKTKQAIAASFDNDITYFKGATVMRMFEMFTGAEKWREFMRGYVRAHAWGNATADDFIGAVGQKFGGIEASMRGFLEQPGVPRISVETKCGGDGPRTLVLSQKRSLPAGVEDPSPTLWQVPVCMRYGDDRVAKDHCFLMVNATATVQVDTCPTWVILNANGNGYYRSVVDPKVARGLLDPKSAIAKIAKPTTSERIMVLGDLRAMVRRDELPVDQLLALVPLVANDPDDKVAAWAVNIASIRADALDDTLYEAYRQWFGKTLGKRAKALGWLRAKTDSDERQRIRADLVPAVAPIDPVLGKEGQALGDKWLATHTGLDDELVNGALAVGAYYGDAARFDRYLAAAKAARDRNERSRILDALGAFRDPALTTRALELIGKDFDVRDSISIVYVAFGRDTRDAMLRWLGTHIDELLGRMRDDEATWFLGGLAAGFCDVERRKFVEGLVSERAKQHDGAEVAVKRGLERSDHCISELARQLPAIKRALGK